VHQYALHFTNSHSAPSLTVSSPTHNISNLYERRSKRF
jgi:hypothetical protein